MSRILGRLVAVFTLAFAAGAVLAVIADAPNRQQSERAASEDFRQGAAERTAALEATFDLGTAVEDYGREHPDVGLFQSSGSARGSLPPGIAVPAGASKVVGPSARSSSAVRAGGGHWCLSLSFPDTEVVSYVPGLGAIAEKDCADLS